MNASIALLKLARILIITAIKLAGISRNAAESTLMLQGGNTVVAGELLDVVLSMWEAENGNNG